MVTKMSSNLNEINYVLADENDNENLYSRADLNMETKIIPWFIKSYLHNAPDKIC